MSEPNFSLGINFEVENSAVNEYLSDKTQLTDQEVDIFVEEQRNPRTVKKTNLDVSKFVKFEQRYRGYYMAARRYEISLRVLKNISRVSAANE